jgi:hypothetical protein
MRCSQSPPIARRGSEVPETRHRLAEVSSLAPTLLTISVISCAATVTGCARNPAQRGFNPVRHEAGALAPAHIAEHFEPRRYCELRIYRPDVALLEPQPAPDCEFKGAGAGVEAVDPAELKRLKLEYERQCYRKAEQTAREHLRLLQASSRCWTEPVQHRQSRSKRSGTQGGL